MKISKEYLNKKLNESRNIHDVNDNELGFVKGVKNIFKQKDWTTRPSKDIGPGIHILRSTSGFNSSVEPLVNLSKRDSAIGAGAVASLVGLGIYGNHKMKKRWEQQGCDNEHPDFKDNCLRYLEKLKAKKK